MTKIIIIGAGISGLSAGCYLQMNGYETQIFEMHNIAGGLCTSWKRKEYTFDGSIHWLCGSREGGIHTLWEELGALNNKEIYNHNLFVENEFCNGEKVRIYTNVDLLEEELLRISPLDKKLIKKFTKAIRIASKYDLPVLKPQDLFTKKDLFQFIFKSFPLLKVFNTYSKISIKDFQKQFKSPFLRKEFCNLFSFEEDMAFYTLIFTLGLLNQNNAGYPIGGSLEFIKNIEKRYLELGGTIQFNSRVKKIEVENNTATGIILEDGSKYEADIVISASDAHATLFDLLENKFPSSRLTKAFQENKLFPSLIQVSLGVKNSLDYISQSVIHRLELDKPLIVDPLHKTNNLNLKVYNFDPTLATKNHTPIVVLLEADYEYWNSLKKENISRYKEEKERISNETIQRIAEKYPIIKDKIEVIDVSTPSTFVRYTNNYKGCYEGFLPTIQSFGKRFDMTLPNLDHFYMIGQWLEAGGGIPTGAMHGRHVTQYICKKYGKDFITMK